MFVKTIFSSRRNDSSLNFDGSVRGHQLLVVRPRGRLALLLRHGVPRPGRQEKGHAGNATDRTQKVQNSGEDKLARVFLGFVKSSISMAVSVKKTAY